MCIFEDILCNSAGVLDEWCFTFVVSFLVVLTGTGLNLQLWVVVLFKYDDDFTDVGDFFGQLPYDGGFLSGHTLLMSVALKMVHKKHRFYPCLGPPSFQRRPTPENLSEESLATGRSLHWALPDKTIDMLLIWSRPKYNPQKVKVMEFMR